MRAYVKVTLMNSGSYLFEYKSKARDFTNEEFDKLKYWIVESVKGNVLHWEFEEYNGNLVYFSENMLKNSIIELIKV